MKITMRNILHAAILCLPVVLTAGCAVVSFLVASFAPQPKIQAQFVLPKGRCVLVMTDDLVYPLAYPPLKRLLADKIGEQLLGSNLAGGTIDYQKLRDLQDRTIDFDTMPIDQVARRLGADYVLYVDIRQFQLRSSEIGSLWKGRLEAFVKVVDSAGGRLWPTDRTEGYEVTVETPVFPDDSEAFGLTLTEMLADLTANRVANLFRQHPEEW
ncbi:MAG: hypothetical protein HQ546_01755 [Planctomycetes bacterium]|nr:hypothetical protein [Planctomycetota bacterium]